MQNTLFIILSHIIKLKHPPKLMLWTNSAGSYPFEVFIPLKMYNTKAGTELWGLEKNIHD